MTSGMESISKVEEAESQAKALVEKANARGKAVVDEANSKARNIVENAATTAAAQKTARIAEATKRLEAENRKAVADAQKDASKVRGRKVSREVVDRLARKVADLILGE
jgi:vacuolar-type H+-ATPase subunit H